VARAKYAHPVTRCACFNNGYPSSYKISVVSLNGGDGLTLLEHALQEIEAGPSGRDRRVDNESSERVVFTQLHFSCVFAMNGDSDNAQS
jgi:hypothetical protein